MIEDIKLCTFPKESGAYLFKVDEEVIYVGSSKNLYMRMSKHKSSIKKGSEHGYKQDLYHYLQSNKFTVEFKATDNYRQLEQELIEQHHPKYNAIRAYTGLGAFKGRETEYGRERYQKYKEEILGQSKQYYESNKEEILGQRKQYYASHEQQKKQYQRIYDNQLCLYNGETLALCALRTRFKRQGIPHPQIEAKKYLIRSSND